MRQYRASHEFKLTFFRLAIAGDLHGSWVSEDQELLRRLEPDGVLFVGDLGEGDLKTVKAINNLPYPTAVILGNHDRGYDRTGDLLRTQLSLLGERHCGWRLTEWEKPNLALVGARPCSAGGGFHLSSEMERVYGQVSLEESINRIVFAAKTAPRQIPLIILAHSGPTGLGSEASSPCGRDWKLPAIDWGDKDLALALDQIRKERLPDLVVFGHMHHALKKGKGYRSTFVQDCWGTRYLNAACVPRRAIDDIGESLCHFSWVEFNNCQLEHVSHRWYRSDASIAYKEVLFDNSNTIRC